MKQQTAVEWVWNKIALKLSVEQINEFLPEFEQAKQMEKEQILYAFGEKRQFMGFGNDDEFWITDMTAEKYYNETYKK